MLRHRSPLFARRVIALVTIVAAPTMFVACGDDEGPLTPGPTNPNSTTTNAPQTVTSVDVPTSATGAAPGQGSQPEQPGGTAQPSDPSATNITMGADTDG